jgi:hypothetical protein
MHLISWTLRSGSEHLIRCDNVAEPVCPLRYTTPLQIPVETLVPENNIVTGRHVVTCSGPSLACKCQLNF